MSKGTSIFFLLSLGFLLLAVKYLETKTREMTVALNALESKVEEIKVPFRVYSKVKAMEDVIILHDKEIIELSSQVIDLQKRVK